MDSEEKSKISFWGWLSRLLIGAAVTIGIFYVQSKISGQKEQEKAPAVKKNYSVDSGTQTNIDSARDIFQNSGQQNNNPGSGNQTITNNK